MGWVVSVMTRPRFTPGERTPGTNCTGGCVGPRADLDTDVRGNNHLPLPGIEPRSPGRPVRSQTLYWLSYIGCSKVLVLTINCGRAMAQVVSRRPLIAEARVRPLVNARGICGEQSGTGTGFSPSSSIFPCQYIIPPSLSKLISPGECVIC
jgi:hypothetical protein